MKQKLTINDLAIGNLKARKKEYAIMIIGIILAMVFSSSVIFAFSAINNSIADITAKTIGRENVIWHDVSDDIMRDAKRQGIFRDYGYAHIMGELHSTDEEILDYTSFALFDDKAMEIANPIIIDGRMPEAEGEIAIESIKLSKMGIAAKVGDKITFNVKVQNGSEVFDEAVPQTFTLVGILSNKANNINFTTGMEEEKIPTAIIYSGAEVALGGKEKLFGYARFNEESVSRGENNKWEKFLESYDYDYTMRNVSTLSYKSSMYINNSEAMDVPLAITFVIIIIAVFMLASCLVIINTFNSNLKERKKQIGLLRAVGATKRQIVSIYAREAIILSLITTPVSCTISYFLVKIIISIMGDSFSYHPDLWVFPVTALFGILCVMLASLIPLFVASRITPMQAIRNIENARKMKTKHIKSHKSYNVSSLISKRSVTFGKGKQIAVTVILVISIIASGYAVSYYTYTKDNLFENNEDYRVSLSSDSASSYANYKKYNTGFSQTDKINMESNPYITASNSFKTGRVNLLVPYDISDYRKHLSEKYERDYDVSYEDINKDNYESVFFSKLYESKDDEKLGELFGTTEFISTDITACEEKFVSSLKGKLVDGKIDIRKLNSGEEIILVAPKRAGIKLETGRYEGLLNVYNDNAKADECIYSDTCDFNSGDEFEIGIVNAIAPTDEEGENDMYSIIPDDAEVVRKKVRIGAIVENDFEGYDGFYIGNFGVLTTTAGMENFVPGLKYKSICFELNQPCNDKIDKSVMEVLNSVTDNIECGQVESNYGYKQMQREINAKLLIAAMSIIILVFIIALSIVNNTITSDIRNSKLKIGTLRAVGADVNVLVKAYTNEMLSMIMWGIGIGTGGFLISFLVYYLVARAKHFEFTFVFNPTGSLIFVFVLIIICCINLFIKVKKEMKNSIVENIREL